MHLLTDSNIRLSLYSHFLIGVRNDIFTRGQCLRVEILPPLDTLLRILVAELGNPESPALLHPKTGTKIQTAQTFVSQFVRLLGR